MRRGGGYRIGETVHVFEVVDREQFTFFWAISAIEGDDRVDTSVEGGELLGEDRLDFPLKLLSQRESDDPGPGHFGQCE